MSLYFAKPGPICVRPKDASGRELISVRGALEWAFAVECASLDYDEIGEAAGTSMPSRGNECRIAEQLALGARRGEGVRVDTSFGRSHPHNDADLIATVLRNTVSHFGQAIWVANLARAQATPKFDLGPQRIEPRFWTTRGCQAGQRGKAEVLETITYRSRRRGLVRRKVLYTPIRYVPDASQIAAARRAWLEWWGILLSLRVSLQHVELERFVITETMPPMRPWKKTS